MKDKIRFAALLGGWLLLSGALSCSRTPTLLVSVQGVPMEAQSLHVIATHAGQAAIRDLEPYPLSAPAPATTTFLLQLPADFMGDIAVAVAAYAAPEAGGCVIATGTAQREVAGGDNNLPLALTATADTRCSGKRPSLLSVTPKIAKTTGGETLTLTGWGFKPGIAVTLGSKPAPSIKYISPVEMQVTVPPHAGFGPVNVKLTNKDGATDMRNDLLRFQADPVQFAPPPLTFPPSQITSVVVALFHPGTTANLAITQPADKQVQVIFTTNGMPVPDAVEIAVGNEPSSVVAPDINNDKLPDLVVANAGDNTVGVIRNMGSGTFSTQVTYATGMRPMAVAAADLNGDGFADIVTANQNSDDISVLINDKAGGFLPMVDYDLEMGSRPTAVAIGDFDQDQRPDIMVSATSRNEVVLFINQPGGVFEEGGAKRIKLTAGTSPMGLLPMDVNSDGKLDLLVANAGSNNVLLYVNNGGYKVQPVYLDTEAGPRSVASGDLDGDGLLDLVVPCGVRGSINIFVAKPDGSFLPYRSFPVRVTTPLQAGMFDVDLDGKQDIGVVGTMNVDVLYNQSN